MDMDMDMDMGTDTDTDIDADIDTDMDTDLDMNMDTDKDMDTDTGMDMFMLTTAHEGALTVFFEYISPMNRLFVLKAVYLHDEAILLLFLHVKFKAINQP
jgi:hypothetical protein